MPRSEEEEGDGFNATITEMLNTFIAQWGDTTRRLQESSEDSQREVIRLTDLTEAMQRLFEEVVRELARQGGNTTTIGNLSGTTI